MIRAAHNLHDKDLTYTFDWSSFSDSAWRSARDTGALSYMTYQQVQNLADVYGQQEIVNQAAINIFEEQPRSLAPIFIFSDPNKVSDVELQRMQERSADELVSVRVMEQIVAQLLQQYQSTLKKF